MAYNSLGTGVWFPATRLVEQGMRRQQHWLQKQAAIIGQLERVDEPRSGSLCHGQSESPSREQ